MVRTERAENGLATLSFARPPLNILTQELLGEMRAELAGLARDTGIRALVLSGEGEHFSAGADVGEHLPPAYRSMIPEFLDTVLAVAEFPAPVIAAVRGRCLGGGLEIALAADWIVAGAGASFGQPEIRLGVIAPAACVLLPERVPRAIASEILFTGEAIDAARALGAGLVRTVVPDAEVTDAARALAARVTVHSSAALRATKRAMRLASLQAAGRLYVDELMTTRDANEGLRAFLEKRKAVWTHQ